MDKEQLKAAVLLHANSGDDAALNQFIQDNSLSSTASEIMQIVDMVCSFTNEVCPAVKLPTKSKK